jgi:hemolysin activation/secretion protein
MTGYKMTKFVNEQLLTNGLKEIPAQMIYQYIAKGYIASYASNGQKLVDQDVMIEWTAKYVQKRIEKAAA